MPYFLAILAGAIQGLTEFIPVSSTAHLVIFHNLFGFDLPDNLAFDAILHLGTFFALLAFFWREIWGLIKGFFSSLTNWNLKNDFNQRLAWLIVVGSIPAVMAGFLLNDLIDQYLHNGRPAMMVIAAALILVALLFWLAERYAEQTDGLKELTWKKSLLVGLAQSLALIPGVSRSGLTIIAGLGQKLKRGEAAKFSFLLSMPIIFGAGAKSLLQIGFDRNVNWLMLACGFLSALFFGYLAVKFLLKYLTSHSLSVFAWYRVILAAALACWLIFY